MSQKVAIITGGASGIGLAVATHLAATGAWAITILDLNQPAGEAAAASLPSTTFLPTDVTSYASLSTAFHTTFTTHAAHLDFVFANAGIAEHDSFYAALAPTDPTGPAAAPPPPPPNTRPLDTDLTSVVHTTWLAQHYFRRNAHRRGGVLTMTASVGGLYALPLFPLYCAAKHGVLGLMRSVAGPMYARDGIRVNAVCPGTVRTGLLPPGAWDRMDVGFTPVERVVEAVVLLLGEGEGEEDGLWGKAVEVSGVDGRWFREQPEFRDPEMMRLLGGVPVQSGSSSA